MPLNSLIYRENKQNMRIIESFSEFINGQDFLMESLNRDGYLLILASTDPNNLKNASATPLGISQDTEYSGTLKGAGDMVNIGYKKNFSGKLVKGAGVVQLSTASDDRTHGPGTVKCLLHETRKTFVNFIADVVVQLNTDIIVPFHTTSFYICSNSGPGTKVY